ncbi:PIN domain-containing protein [Moraxella oblonga]|uniref:PIN domain-containing protein n=1 Tax=Moraxella oblonga TaxID=200413 RepID=UPI000835AD0F
MLFNRFQAKLPITDDILECTIALRRAYKIKLPDALILATAKTHQLTLLTLDEKLERIYQQTNS